MGCSPVHGRRVMGGRLSSPSAEEAGCGRPSAAGRAWELVPPPPPPGVPLPHQHCRDPATARTAGLLNPGSGQQPAAPGGDSRSGGGLLQRLQRAMRRSGAGAQLGRLAPRAQGFERLDSSMAQQADAEMGGSRQAAC